MQDQFVSTEHLFLAIVGERGPVARPPSCCAQRGITRERDARGARRRCAARSASPIQNPEGKYQALENYGRDLTELAERASSTR